MGLVGFRFMPAGGVAENLFHHAALAGWVVSQNGAKLLEGGKFRMRNALNVRGGVQIELEFFGLSRLVGYRIALQLDPDNLLVAIAADVVVLLESQPDGVDQI